MPSVSVLEQREEADYPKGLLPEQSPRHWLESVHAASHRLHDVMRLDACPRFAPHFSPAQGPHTIMDIEHDESSRTVQGANRSPQGLLECLEYWSRRNGCKKIDAQSICFKSIQWRTPASLDYGWMTDATIGRDLEIDTRDGGEISLYKTNIMSESGRIATWLWFKITKPVCSILGEAPRGADALPKSWVVFAMPNVRADKIEEA
ncbi:hypothetical protein B0I35DRAFT_478424 [Stachybotrys elegans]|uniref:Uncharacterized protein n=1 Tax=Stachybotrys elegans TaxID=80388 RepID=A0A8K0WSS3_9HYPO|nr:hypothetical protein B0I35DRAFT_478424 [Stachybotrys elegans]